MNEIKNLNNFKSTIADQGYVYCDLFTGDGKKVFNRNRLKPDFDTHYKKIINKINSPNTEKGTYLIGFYTSQNTDGDVFCYHKGGVSTLSESTPGQKITIVQKEKEKPENNVLSYTSALNYQNEINKLTYDIQLKDKEIADLKDQLKDWEENYEEEDEDNPTLSEPKKDFMTMLKETLETFSATALPIIDRHYTLKEKSLELELMKLGIKPKVGARPVAKPNPEEEAKKQILVEQIEGFLEALGEKDEDHYAELEKLSTETSSLEEWLVKVKELFPGTYSEMENYLKNAA